MFLTFIYILFIDFSKEWQAIEKWTDTDNLADCGAHYHRNCVFYEKFYYEKRYSGDDI